MNKMDLNILEQFLTFYRSGTLRKTSEETHISQPALTRNMQKLESEIGAPIFNRTKNSISLNETGKIAAQEASIVMNHYNNMLRRAREFDKRNRTIVLGSCTPVYISDLIKKITAVYPAAAVSAETEPINKLIMGIKNHDYDLIFLPFELDDKSVVSIKWGEEHLSFLLPKKHRYARRKKLNASDMNGENMLLFSEIGFWYDLVTNKMPDSQFFIQTNRTGFIELIEKSTMPAFTTDYQSREFENQNLNFGRVEVPISDPEFNVCYYLICLKENLNKFKELFPTDSI